MANAKARALRKSMTPQEVKLGSVAPIASTGLSLPPSGAAEGYILDFVCFKYRIIVEADGSQHGEDEGVTHDVRRDAFFAAQGFRTLRFWNHQIDADLHGVVDNSRASAGERRRFPVGE